MMIPCATFHPQASAVRRQEAAIRIAYTTPPTSTFGRRAFTIACPTAWDDGTVYRTPSGILTSLYIAVLARRAYWVVF